MKKFLVFAVSLVATNLVLFPCAALAQDDAAQHPQVRFQGERQGIGGTIAEIKGDTLVVKTLQGGTATVKTTAETAYRADRQQAKFSDLKVGDFVFVGGEQSGKDQSGNPQWTARFVGKRTGGPGGGPMISPEEMGKKFIFGEVTKIDGTKLTIKRPDNVEQVIEVDDDTSFLNARRENITFPEIKVGDHVGGPGELKAGTFVPKTLRVGPPPQRMMMMRGPEGGQPPAPPHDGDILTAPATEHSNDSKSQDHK